MKKTLYTALFLLCLTASFTHAQNAQDVNFYSQKQNDFEFKRVDQELKYLKQQNLKLFQYIRELEVKNDQTAKKMKLSEKKVEDLLDLWVNFENVSLPNLTAADKTLAERVKKADDKIKEHVIIETWGELARDCPTIGKHQQVKTITTKDKTANIKYLCFDGKVLHLKTESNLPPRM
ncbi:MAG: hypothetical protein GY793_04655 [Proteobacteria bacterium]|nr:hypothetical protein [Pseudomonadota bacterium]